MLPGVLVGLILFAACLGPGYVWHRVAEQRVPQAERSSLLETIELVVIGSVATTISALVVLTIPGWIDGQAIDRLGASYLVLHSFPALSGIVVAILLGCLGAYIAASCVYRKQPPLQRHGSVWQQVLRLDREGRPFVTAELRDGRRFSGQLAVFSLDANPSERELAIAAPIHTMAPGDLAASLLADQRMIIRGSEINYLSVTFIEASNDAQ